MRSRQISPSSAGWPCAVEQHHRVAGKRAPHRAGLDRLAGRIAHHGGRLGLAEAVADGHSPGRAHLRDHLRIQRLAGARHLAQLHAPGAQVVLDEHAPHCRRCTECGDLAVHQLLQQRARIEALVVVGEDRRLRVPGRKEARPGMLRPPRRAQIQVYVPGLQSQPVHGREMPDRVADVRVRDQFRARGRARGEIQQQQLVGTGARRRKARRRSRGVRKRDPPRDLSADGDAQRRPRQARESRAERCLGDDRLDASALETIAQIPTLQQRGRRNHHHAQTDRRQHRLPQRHAVRQHHQQAITAAEAEGGEEAGNLRRALLHLRERQRLIRPGIIDDTQRSGVVVGGDHVEVIVCPVELFEAGPAEVAVRERPILAPAQQLIPQSEKIAAVAHARIPETNPDAAYHRPPAAGAHRPCRRAPRAAQCKGT